MLNSQHTFCVVIWGSNRFLSAIKPCYSSLGNTHHPVNLVHEQVCVRVCVFVLKKKYEVEETYQCSILAVWTLQMWKHLSNLYGGGVKLFLVTCVLAEPTQHFCWFFFSLCVLSTLWFSTQILPRKRNPELAETCAHMVCVWERASILRVLYFAVTHGRWLCNEIICKLPVCFCSSPTYHCHAYIFSSSYVACLRLKIVWTTCCAEI